MLRFFKSCFSRDCFLRREDGATAIEYALIAGGIALVIAATVFLLGGTVSGLYVTVSGIFGGP